MQANFRLHQRLKKNGSIHSSASNHQSFGPNPRTVEVRNDVRKALEDYGCFDVSYNGVSVELKKSMIEAMEELFELPVEAKQRNVCPKPYTGYLSYNGLSESLGIQDADVLEKVNEFTQQIRPDCEGNKKIR